MFERRRVFRRVPPRGWGEDEAFAAEEGRVEGLAAWSSAEVDGSSVDIFGAGKSIVILKERDRDGVMT